MSEQSSDPDLRKRLNEETARIGWRDLQVYYARGQVVEVDPAMNLLDVAVALSKDEANTFRGWMDQGRVRDVKPDQARQWYDDHQELWALVVAPWVLVQNSSTVNAAGSGHAVH